MESKKIQKTSKYNKKKSRQKESKLVVTSGDMEEVRGNINKR